MANIPSVAIIQGPIQTIHTTSGRIMAIRTPSDAAEFVQRSATWHMGDIAHVSQQLQADDQGLSTDEAVRRQAEFGPNRLPQRSTHSPWQIVSRQFSSPLIYVLIVASIVSMSIGDYKDAGFIAAVLAVNALIGSYQEWRAEKSRQALQRLLHVRALVTRDGMTQEIDAEEVVPGDIIWLESGNRVPADLRLINTQGVEVDESLLTGESLAVRKECEWSGEPSAPLADRLNLAYAASIVIRGRAKGIVVATGVSTLIGQLAIDVLSSEGGKPPLIERMERFSKSIAVAVVGAVVVVSMLGIFIHKQTLSEMFLFGVALAVSAIPEGLPAALTVALAVATTRMARRGVIVRRLAAVEGLGSCTMIASDKTGTLTCNELTVRSIWLDGESQIDVVGVGFAPMGNLLLNDQPVSADTSPSLANLVRGAILCNEAALYQHKGKWEWRGDPTDIALLSLGIKAGLSRESLIHHSPEIEAIPFEPEQQFAATCHRINGQPTLFVKGAPERVLGMCDGPCGTFHFDRLLAVAESMAAQGYRVLGLADGTGEVNHASDGAPLPPNGLTFRGFVGMIDPLRPGVIDAVNRCHSAGIRVCMVTGDHPVTALAIARELGLADNPGQVVNGADLAKFNEEELLAAIRRGRVFARVGPRQKLELVNAARADGHFVAVTGDGVNDAPALKAANVGMAMGRSGTDVAREAADLIISDDNFSTLVNGVEEGRIAYDNIRKVIYLLVSAGTAEVLLIGVAFAAGTLLPLPFLPVQLLWLNLVTNGIQGVALAFEPGDENVLKRKPRPPREPIFDQLMFERTIVAAIVMAVVGVLTFSWMIYSNWTTVEARNGLLLLMVLFENIHIGNCRSETESALLRSPLRSPLLLAGAIGALLIHVAGMHIPFLQELLQTTPVSWKTWSALLGLSLTVFVALELHKWTWKLRYNQSGKDSQE